MLVVKIGGSVADIDPVLRDVAGLGEPLLLVHGAGRELDALSAQLGAPPRVVHSGRGDTSRYTDATTMDHFLMAYAGRANKRIVEGLRRRGVDAVGLTGLDGGIVRGKRRPDLRCTENGRAKVLHGNHVGTIERIEPALLRLLFDAGHVPVIAPPMAGEDGTALNVDGDRMAAELAVALGARTLVILSDTSGLLRDLDDPASTIPTVARHEVDGVARRLAGRARTKLRAADSARSRGVTAVLAAAFGERPLTAALRGAGTQLR